jgi:signal transduction histidine kinase
MPGGRFPGGMLGGRLPGDVPGGRLPGGHPGGQGAGGQPGGHAPGGNLPGNGRGLPGGAMPGGTLPQPMPALTAARPVPIATIAPGSEPIPAITLAAPDAATLPAPVAVMHPTRLPEALSAHPAIQLGLPRLNVAPQPRIASAIPVETAQPIPFRHSAPSLLRLASPPFIEGDFVAAARQADGSWLAVAPRPEPFPNRWQQQVLAWFLISLAVVSPLAWLFVRRIVLPLQDFVRAAEALGRDPSATIVPLSGPAEIGRAARAFNQMRSRLTAFVDDRTAMVGAISHDLRTPLTRLRFRIEDVPDAQREGLLKEVNEMEAMIAQVITFIRDASTPGPRQRLDFGDLVADSVRDAQLTGDDISIEGEDHVSVEVDPVGMRRLLANLLENAVKYGTRARVRIRHTGEEAFAEIFDDGPGIPEDEWDRAFEPFYRSEAARRSGKPGTGLGLAVCRSIARAHGGEVALEHAPEGFVARLSLPLVYEGRMPEGTTRFAA